MSSIMDILFFHPILSTISIVIVVVVIVPTTIPIDTIVYGLKHGLTKWTRGTTLRQPWEDAIGVIRVKAGKYAYRFSWLILVKADGAYVVVIIEEVSIIVFVDCVVVYLA